MGQHADMGDAVINEVLIDLVADQVDVAVTDQLGQLLQLGTGNQRATGVVRRVEDDHPRARAERILKSLEVDREILRCQLHMHAAPACQGHRGLVAVIGRVKDDDLVTAVDHRLDRAEDRLGGTRGDCHLVFGINADPIAAGDLRRHLLAQCRQACHGAILVVSIGHVPPQCIAQGLRAVEIGEALGQVERAARSRELGHLGEDSDADIRQLAGDHQVFPTGRSR